MRKSCIAAAFVTTGTGTDTATHITSKHQGPEPRRTIWLIGGWRKPCPRISSVQICRLCPSFFTIFPHATCQLCQGALGNNPHQPPKDGAADKMKDDLFHHGGAIDLAAKRYGIALDQWLDLSTGINPLPYDIGDIPVEYWQRLPLARDLEQVLGAAEQYYGIPVSGHIVCAPGTQALIQLLPFVLAAKTPIKKVAVLGPTYGEHAPAWQRAGMTTTEIQTTPQTRQHLIAHPQMVPTNANADAKTSLETSGWQSPHDNPALAAVIDDHDVFVIVNPNNPDGGVTDAQTLRNFANHLQDRGKYLILDEAFADTCPENTLCGHIAELENTVILRSFGKFFGLAGMRVGFAVGAPALIADLADRLGPWSVPGPALHIATQALADKNWQQQTRENLHHQANWLDEQVLRATGTGAKLLGGTDLLRLYAGPSLPALQQHLAQRGIWVRGFVHAPNWLRFGLPGTQANMDRLATALADFQMLG
ncbi:threonine-phosphate decarboxylase [Thalassospira marina]|uniref:threonine-phosphate decarboxylase n=2 Tax=Thalassospira marina TaxID=2048283 RepID=A0ABM6Q6P2_9PROT|nr:threonine-phosphate decarboxylase [Thalassospira marina]